MEKRYRCNNCEKTWYNDEVLLWIKGFFERTEPGNEIPAGECPECGALCYVVKPVDHLREAAPDLLEACEEMLQVLNVLDGDGAILYNDECNWSKWEKAISKAKGGE